MLFIFTGYVDELYMTLTTTPRDELKIIEEELHQQTPEPMHSMFDKESVVAATTKHIARKQKVTTIYPPTCSGKYIIQWLFLT